MPLPSTLTTATVGSASKLAAGEKTHRPMQSLAPCGGIARQGTSGINSDAARSIGGSRFGRTRAGLWSALLNLLSLLLIATNTAPPCQAAALSVRSLPRYARAATTSLLEVFQVYPPVLTVTPQAVLELSDGSSNGTVEILDNDYPSCRKVLAVHSFAASYGNPFVANYTPPGCAFNHVTWNLTVTSAGRQFDRLGIVYLGDIEVLRTSTAEPTSTGIEWTYLKDMTSYLSLFKQESKIIFDLGNLITDVYTAAFNVTLTASFFNASSSITPADLILPVSRRLSAQDKPSVFTVLSDVASNALTIPRNVKQAVFTLAATGQSAEEFWWSNVLQSEVDTFPDYGTLYSFSPFREVQLFIDGMLAGLAWPFPIIFTGGVVPGLWRPIVGIDAFDLKEDEIDVTAWLPLLCDGGAHDFTIKVSGLNDTGNGTATLSGVTNSYWLVTGKLFIWSDEEGRITTGNGPHIAAPAPSLQVSSSVQKKANGTNETLLYQVNAQRSLSVSSTISLSTGNSTATWDQNLSFTNSGNFTDGGNIELNEQQTTGYDVSSSGYARHFSYPLYAYSVYATIGDNISYVTTVNRDKDVKILGQPVFPTGLEAYSSAHDYDLTFQGSSLSTSQNGNATYLANQTSQTSFSYGTTAQDMLFKGIRVEADAGKHAFPPISETRELFHRHVVAVNSSIAEDEETLVDETTGYAREDEADMKGLALANIPGRGGHWQRLIQQRQQQPPRVEGRLW